MRPNPENSRNSEIRNITNNMHMNLKHIYAIIAIATGCILAGCQSKDVDLDNIDLSAETQFGMALPIGTINLAVGDFLSGNGNLYVDSLPGEKKGVLTYKIDTTIARYYHQVDLKQHISSKTLKLSIYDRLREEVQEYPDLMQYLLSDNKVTGNGTSITLDFPITIKLSGINEPYSVLGERLDSALIELASFTSRIETNHLPLRWEWIDRVSIDLGPQVTRPAGNLMTVYDKNRDTDPDIYNYGKEVPMSVDNFSIVMMKDRNPKGGWAAYQYNVVDTCLFHIYFTFTIPNGVELIIPTDAEFEYTLGVQFIDFKAIWGMFRPSSDMHKEEVIDLVESWGALEFLKRSRIPFSDPIVDVNISTEVAGALYIDSAYIFTETEGVRKYAMFKEGQTTRTIYFDDGQYLPLDSKPGEEAKNMNLRFDKTEEGGQIHRLFGSIPQNLGYRFSVKFNEQKTPQIRVTNNTAVKLKTQATLPLMFGDSLYIEYSDTILDVNLSQYSIDSLLRDVKVVKSVDVNELNLILKAENEIPVRLKAYMRCLDAKGKVIPDPTDESKPLLLFEQDTIMIDAPTYADNGGWHKTANGTTTITAHLTQEKLDMLPSVKGIIYTVVIDNESLQEAYNNGLSNVKIKNTDRLKLTIGLSADVKAALDFNNNNQ